MRALVLACLLFASLLLSQESASTSAPCAPSNDEDKISVVGDVYRPTVFATAKNQNFGVLQALMIADGANQTARLHDAKIHRKHEDGSWSSIPVDIQQIAEGEAPDVTLEPGDVLIIPSSEPQRPHPLYYDGETPIYYNTAPNE
jgi:hypothetical protein